MPRAPLDDQQEKTRAYYTPVGRQQELASHSPGLPAVPQTLKVFLAFSRVYGILIPRKLCESTARQTLCRFYYFFWDSARSIPKSFRMNTSRSTARLAVLYQFF